MATARYLVGHLEAAVRFYTGRLGFAEGRGLGPVASVHHRDLELWLSAPGSSGRDQEGAAVGGWNRIVLEVSDLDAAVGGLSTRGPRVEGPAGSWRLVEDPWGNPIELFQPR